MDKPISSGLKNTFLIHIFVGGIFGLIYLFIPEMFGGWINWPVTDTEMYRVVGAAILGFTVSSVYGYRAKSWDEVKIIVRTEIVWTALAALVMLYGVLFTGLPAFAWVNAILLAGFAVAFFVFSER
jgi:hypothetical protein